MTSRRNTIQKDLVRNAVYEMRRHVTANEVYEFIKAAYPTIGKGTVYRNLDILVDEGSLRKVEVPDGPNRFDFSLKNHYHVRCAKCGEVSDVDMDEIPDLLKHLRKKDSLSLQQNSRQYVRLRSTMKKDIVHFLRIVKLLKFLKRVKLKYGNAVTADILW